MKIKNRLMITYGILVMLALIVVVGNLMIFRTMESDSNFVNYLGKLRATSYKIAQLSNVVMHTEDQMTSDELERSIQYFESLITRLPKGDSTLGMSPLIHKSTIENLNHIEVLWETRYKPAYSSISTYKNIESLRIINEEVGTYVNFIDEMVTSYSEDARLKVTRAKYMNSIIIIIIIGAAIFSFRLINNGIRKPIELLIGKLRELSLVDRDLEKKIENISKDEINVIEGYFNELIYDSLTEVYNRRSGLAKLSRMFQKDDRRELTMSLCFIDINGLKQVNDKLGHKYGDELITSSINIIKNIIRDYDFVIRLGGDEFLIVFNHINGNTAETIWSRIVEAYDKVNKEENRPYLISVSHGIQEYNNQQKSDLDSLIKKADEKMYKEKRIMKEKSGNNIIR